MTGAAAGALESVFVTGSPASVIARAVLVSAAAALLGLLQWAAVRVADRVLDGDRLLERWRACTSRSAAERGPVLTMHAVALSVGSVLVALAGVTAWITLRLRSVNEDPVVALLTTVFVLGGTVGGGLAVVVGFRPLTRMLGAVDARIRLPVPGGMLGYLSYAVVPVGALAAWVLVRFGEELGTLTLVFLSLPFVAVQGFVWRALRPWWPSPRRWAVVGVVWVGMVVTVSVGLDSREGLRALTRRGVVFPASVKLLRGLTDLDADGHSSVLGGRDCAPFDGARAPGAREIVGNGIDEDCDGEDAVETAEGEDSPRRLLYGKLPSEQVRRYNIVWIVVDALRADAVGFTRFEGKKPQKGRSATPYLDELAKESWVFHNAYSQSSMTMLSMPSMFAGRWPGNMGWRKHTNRPNAVDDELLIAEQLKEAGYRTGKVASGYLVKRLPGQFQGQDTILNYWLGGKRNPWFKYASRLAVAMGIEFLESDPTFPRSDQPFFLTLYTDGPHNPYILHPDSGFATNKTPWSRYRGEIADTDQLLKTLLEYLRYQDEGKLWDNTIVIVSADHGEEFKEHGNTFHARTCHEESVHVPLLVRIPGMAPTQIDTRVAMVDVVPTLLDFLGMAPGRDDLDGQSLAIPALEPSAVDPHRPIFCTTTSIKASFGKFLRRSVRRDDLVLMTDPVNAEELLFNSTEDRAEQRDLMKSTDRGPEVEALRRALSRTLTGNISELSFF